MDISKQESIQAGVEPLTVVTTPHVNSVRTKEQETGSGKV